MWFNRKFGLRRDIEQFTMHIFNRVSYIDYVDAQHAWFYHFIFMFLSH